MRIESIGVSVPSRKVTNDDILKMLEENSDGMSPIIVKSYKRLVRGLFTMAGSDVRYVRDTDKDEKASTFIFEAMKAALEKANLTKDDIDLLIYCGVGKGFLEPANALFLCPEDGHERFLLRHRGCVHELDQGPGDLLRVLQERPLQARHGPERGVQHPARLP